MTADHARPVAIVTGAGRGIGRAIAAALADDGYRPALVDLDGEAAETAARWLTERGAEAIGAIPVGRVGQPEDVADTVAFLLAPKVS